MNTKRFLVTAAAATASLLIACTSRAQAPTGSLTITPLSGTSNRVTINDPSNSVWVIQAATNFANWTEVGTWKVFNGTFQVGVATVPGGPPVFYRAMYDSSLQTVSDTNRW